MQSGKPARTPLQNVLEVLCTLALLGMIAYLIFAWRGIPAEVPLHYNAAGEITRWGGKGSVLIIPIFALVMYLVMRLVERIPEAWNMPAKAQKRHPEKTWQATRTLLVAVRTAIVVYSFVLTVLIANALSASWGMIVFIAASVFVPIAVYFWYLHRLDKE